MIYEACHDNDVWVWLSDDEIDAAAKHGLTMRKVSVARGHNNHQGYNPNDALANRVQALGAVCEAAVIRALNIDAALTSEVYAVADLPGNIQVRLIGRDHYGLRVYPRDDDDWIVVEVVIPPGREREPYRLPGCFWASAAKRPEWQIAPHGRPPMYAVPQKELLSLSLLKAVLRQ